MWEKTSKKRIKVELYINMFYLSICALVLGLSFIYISNQYLLILVVSIMSVFFILCLYNMIFRHIIYNKHEYFVSDKSISVRRGIIYKVEENIFTNKIYQYNIYKNPLLDKLELVTIKFETAAGTLLIDYIEPIKAQHLVDIIDKNKEITNTDEKNEQIRNFVSDI